MERPLAVEHHISPEILAEYAAGNAPDGVSLVVACHITLCPTCRAEVELFESVGGSYLDRAQPHDGSDLEAMLDSTLGMLDSVEREPPHAPGPPPRGAVDATFPKPLRDLVGTVDEAPWRKRMPGMSTIDIPLDSGLSLRLVRTAAGMGVPRHGHNGMELDLILRGGLEDEDSGQVFERGDVQINGPDVVHQLHVLHDVPECIILSLNEASWRPEGIKARIAYRYLGW